MSTIQRLTINAALLMAAVGSSAFAGNFNIHVYTENAGEYAHYNQFTYQYTHFTTLGKQTKGPFNLDQNPKQIPITFINGVDPKVTVTVTRGTESHTFTRTNTATGTFQLNYVFYGSTPMVFFTHHAGVTSAPVSCPPPCAQTYTCQPARRFKLFGCR